MSQTERSITQLLRDVESSASVSELLPIVYDELRKLAAAQLARETPGQTLQPTALVHEAYLRLVGDVELQWTNRAHFFAAAARSMRQILVNRAIQKKTTKHGGAFKRVELLDHMANEELEPDRLLALDEALEQLEQRDPRKGQVVMLRYFAGLSIDDAAKALEISPATVKREWQFARAWLYKEMSRLLIDS
jgi:RNA polymerase sigma factor (TIGR02999 family)